MSNFLMDLLKSMAQPVTNTKNRIGGGGYELNRSKNMMAGDLYSTLGLNDLAQKNYNQASNTNPFLKTEADIAKATDPLQIAKDSAGVLAFGIPAGKATSVLGKTLAPGLLKSSAITGAMSGFSGSDSNNIGGMALDTTLGAILGVGGGKLLGGKGAKANKAISEVTETANRLGVDLPVSAQTNSRVLKAGEALAQKGFFGGKTAKVVDNAYKQVDNLKQNLSDDVLKAGNFEDAGNIIKKGFGGFVDDFNKAKTSLYDVAQVPDTAAAVINKTKQAIGEIVQSKEGSLVGGTNIDFYTDLLGKLDDNLSYKNLKQTRTAIGQKIGNYTDPVATGDKASLNKLYAALSDDMDEAVKAYDPNLAQQVDKANSFYKEGLSKVNSQMGKLIQGKNPEQLVKELVKPNSQTNIRVIKEIIGEEGTKELQESFLSKLYKEASNDVNGQNILNVKKLRSVIGKYGDDTLKELLGDGGYQNLQSILGKASDIDIVEQALKKGTKMADGSQTSFLGKIGAAGATMAASPAAFAGMILGDAVNNLAFGTKTGRKLLTQGVSGLGMNDEVARVLSGIVAPGAVNSIGASTPGVAASADGLTSAQATQPQSSQSSQPTSIYDPKFARGEGDNWWNNPKEAPETAQGGGNTQELQQALTQLMILDPGNADMYKSMISMQGGGGVASDEGLTEPQRINREKSRTALRALDSLSKEVLTPDGNVDNSLLIKASLPGSLGARGYRSNWGSIIDIIGSNRTGASYTSEQRSDYAHLLPVVGDSPEVVKQKLATIKQELDAYAGNNSPAVAPGGQDILQQILMSGGM